MRGSKLALVILVGCAAGFYAGYRFALPDISAVPGTQPVKNQAIAAPEVSPAPFADEQNARLRKALLRARAQISNLESRNKALAEQVDLLGIPLADDLTYDELLLRVDRLPPDLVRELLMQVFDDAYVENLDNPNAFARDMIDIALQEDLSEDLEEEFEPVGISFSLSPIRGLRSFTSLNEVEQYDRIFTHFIAAQSYPNMIVRWQHRESGEIVQFGPLQLSDNQGQYLSLQPQAGWREGVYQVSVFDLDSDRRLVGTSSFRLETIIEQDAEQARAGSDMDVINDLISRGLARPKSF